jgi:hypothetical protein
MLHQYIVQMMLKLLSHQFQVHLTQMFFQLLFQRDLLFSK